MSINGDKLVWEASVTPAPSVLDALKQHKSDILALLRPRTAAIARVVGELLPDRPVQPLDPTTDGWPLEEDLAVWQTQMADQLSERMRLGWHRIDSIAVVWGGAECAWHARFGVKTDPHHCAGCLAPFAGQPSLALPDGARVHWGEENGLPCLTAYGRRWRGAASAGLVAMGLIRPPTTTPY